MEYRKIIHEIYHIRNSSNLTENQKIKLLERLKNEIKKEIDIEYPNGQVMPIEILNETIDALKSAEYVLETIDKFIKDLKH